MQDNPVTTVFTVYCYIVLQVSYSLSEENIAALLEQCEM